MNDTQLYQQILGLAAPWSMTGVTMIKEERTIEVKVVCNDQAWSCLTCGERAHLHERERRRWRHLDNCQFKTILVADVPRVKCPEHGTVTAQVLWAEKHSGFTALFERLAIDVLQNSPTRSAKASTTGFNASSSKPTATETGRGSKPTSSSTAAASTIILESSNEISPSKSRRTNYFKNTYAISTTRGTQH
jgi:hypothetical protein